MHTSFSPSFETSLVKIYSDTARENTPNLPLEAKSFHDLPRTWIQVCTNDLYYSDGICYAAALREAGVEVVVKVIRGWPHTFWLKAPQLDRALEANIDMIEGLKWLMKLGDGHAQ
jgi:acetyl esterase/lipase